MHNINFINSASPKQQQSLLTWYRITLITLLFVITSLTIVTTWSLYQLFALRSQVQKLKNETAPFIPILKQKNELEKTLKTLSAKKEKIKKHSETTNQHYTLLKSLFKTCAPPLEINSLSIHNGFNQINIYSPDLPHATRFISNLKKETGIEKLIIASLEPDPNQNGYVISIRQPEIK